MKKTLMINGEKFTYELERKKVKNLNLRVRSDGSVYVSANRYVTLEQIERFIESNIDFVLKARAKYFVLNSKNNESAKDGGAVYVFGSEIGIKVKFSDKNYVDFSQNKITVYVKSTSDEVLVKNTLDSWKRKVLEQKLNEICSEIYPKFKSYGFDFPKIRLRKMTSRWGSCIPSKGVITFSTALFSVPIQCVEYVVVHEFAHFVYANHSKQFYSVVESVMPDRRKRENVLKDFGFAVNNL